MAGPRITPEREAAIIAAIRKGQPAWRIRVELRADCETVRRVAKRHELELTTGKGPNMARLKLIHDMDQEFGRARAAVVLGMHPASISNAVRRYYLAIDRSVR